MGGIGVISNPRSGRNRRNPHIVRRLAGVLGDNGHLAQPEGLESLEDVARSFRERDIDVACVNGGDGTLHKALSAIVRIYADGKEGRELRKVRLPLIALLKGGTMNTLARNVGRKANGEEMLGHVVQAYLEERPFRTEERNLMVINGEQAGFLFGNGALSRFLEAYYAGGDASPWKAVKMITRLLASGMVGGRFARELFARQPYQVVVDGREWEAETYAAIAAGTATDLGFGFRPFYGVTTHPDHLHALGFACGPTSVLRAVHRLRLALPMNRPDIYDQLARRFTISSSEPQSYMLDGDFLHGGQTLSVEVGPRVRFIVV